VGGVAGQAAQEALVLALGPGVFLAVGMQDEHLLARCGVGAQGGEQAQQDQNDPE
jgi:hypothetical protein